MTHSCPTHVWLSYEWCQSLAHSDSGSMSGREDVSKQLGKDSEIKRTYIYLLNIVRYLINNQGSVLIVLAGKSYQLVARLLIIFAHLGLSKQMVESCLYLGLIKRELERWHVVVTHLHLHMLLLMVSTLGPKLLTLPILLAVLLYKYSN